MSTNNTIDCDVCGTPTTDQWGGYCHDCDNDFEAVIAEQQWGPYVVKEINPS